MIEPRCGRTACQEPVIGRCAYCGIHLCKNHAFPSKRGADLYYCQECQRYLQELNRDQEEKMLSGAGGLE